LSAGGLLATTLLAKQTTNASPLSATHREVLLRLVKVERGSVRVVVICWPDPR
jgi:hypothetical protein